MSRSGPHRVRPTRPTASTRRISPDARARRRAASLLRRRLPAGGITGIHPMIRLKHAIASALVVAAATAGAVHAAPSAIVTPLMTKPLTEYPGKEAQMISVEYPPGAVDPVHRHHADAFVYVVEG